MRFFIFILYLLLFDTLVAQKSNDRISNMSSDSVTYAKIRTELQKAGTPIGPMDLLIASQAISKDLILVSNNTREFQRVQNLKLENWV